MPDLLDESRGQLERLTADLIRTLGRSWVRIETEQQRIIRDWPEMTRARRLSELRALQTLVRQLMARADELALAFTSRELPQAWELGAAAAAGVIGTREQPDLALLGTVMTSAYQDILAATQGVRDSTKELVRALTRDHLADKATRGLPATTAGRLLRDTLDEHGIVAITYRDGSRHGLDEYCVDETTEILTRRGWLTHEQVQVGDEALAVDPATGLASWQPIEDIYRSHRDGEMVLMESQVHSSLTTPTHRWLVLDQKRRYQWRTSETLRRTDRVPYPRPRSDAPTTPKYQDEFVELVAWWWTEGSRRASGHGQIAQSHRVNEAYVARISRACRSLFGPPRLHRERGPVWCEKRYDSGITSFTFLPSVVAQFDDVAPGKIPTMEFLESLTTAQLDLFIEASIDADGWRTGRSRLLSQRCEQRMKAFEAACALAGIGNSTRLLPNGMWSTTLMRAASTCPRAARVERVQYSGIIWCPTLPHHNWVARRAGKTYVTGNSEMVIRTKSAEAYAQGGLAQMQAAEVDWVELADGFGCGLDGHDDPQKANGLILTVDQAMSHPTSHPRCVRAILPRPDIRTARQAQRAGGSTSGAQDLDQAAVAAVRQAAAGRRAVAARRFARTNAGLLTDSPFRAGSVAAMRHARRVARRAS